MDALLALTGRWSAGRGPLYLLLASRLRQLIEAGELPDGCLLPPDRRLASALAVGRSTVVAAYDVLRQEGRLARVQGSGTRVRAEPVSPTTDAGRNPLFAHLLDRPDDGVLHLTCAAPDDLPPEFAAAHTRALTELTGGLGIHPRGVPSLRRALADRYTDRGVPTTPDQILVTTGAQQALALLTRLLLAPGDAVLTETPTYPGAIELFRDASAVLHTVPVTDAGLDVDAFAAAMRTVRPALAYLTPSFHNPTGSLVPVFGRQRLARAAAELRIPLIDDEVLVDLGFSDHPVPVAAYMSDVITVGSLSKLVWGGLRVGWIRADAATVGKLARLRAMHDLGGNTLSQLAAAHLVHDLDTVRRHRVTLLRERHDHLVALLRRHLPDWRFTPALGGQTLWVTLPDTDASIYAQAALRLGVAVLPGSAFDPAGGGRAQLRVPFVAAPATLTEVVHRLAAAWAPAR
ncbi:GntR family transcriptional regulator [Virgisporangium aurantiacum]|uniref:GntR family transcriptional regulator n=2 Tax=Virgisporangium aurantiacum TaxID=175570 RepID=A0A8J3ZGT4_9ACTN|nr:GntR family transcriptional regulator [Virgisporangium aurantiacum]